MFPLSVIAPTVVSETALVAEPVIEAAGWLSAAVVLGWLARSLAVRVARAPSWWSCSSGSPGSTSACTNPPTSWAAWVLGALWLAAVLAATHLLIHRPSGAVTTAAAVTCEGPHPRSA